MSREDRGIGAHREILTAAAGMAFGKPGPQAAVRNGKAEIAGPGKSAPLCLFPSEKESASGVPEFRETPSPVSGRLLGRRKPVGRGTLFGRLHTSLLTRAGVRPSMA
ncbi:TetR/AcrR family transcriptional regulator, partial [Streptomyces sp. DSM 41529]|nr:TetR/AcrR family transcriptional regulator [Streptomyces sp. DSM 41529]